MRCDEVTTILVRSNKLNLLVMFILKLNLRLRLGVAKDVFVKVLCKIHLKDTKKKHFYYLCEIRKVRTNILID